MAHGTWIVFEGGEGCGKSTQSRLLAQALQTAGYEVVHTREPGGTPSAEKLRELLVRGDADSWHPTTETLLFYAARMEHMARCITPALAAGKVVICDRFADSTRVYQGIGKEQGTAFIDTLHRLTVGTLTPDITYLLDIPVETGLTRAGARRNQDTRFEEMGHSFHQRIREGFLALAAQYGTRYHVLDAQQSATDIHNAIIAHLHTHLALECTPAALKAAQ